jgi:hypothetical protein
VTIPRTLALLGLTALLAVQPAGAHHVSVGMSISGPAGAGSWYRGPVTVTFTVTAGAAVSGNCPSAGTTSISLTSETSPVNVWCAATLDGHTAAASTPIGIDMTAPAITGAAPTRGADANGWYNHAVAVAYTGTDGLSGLAGCDVLTYGGPDSATAGVAGGKCRDGAGNESAAGPAVGFKYDGTAPTVGGGNPGRGPDSGSWYNKPVDVAFAGADGLSGIAGCSSGTYSGPDGASASMSGSCSDLAGNTAGGSFALSYDSTPPDITGANPARPPDANGWHNHPVSFAFAATDDTSGVESCGSPTYSGPDRAEASVSGSCRDHAGNSASKAFPLKYDATPPEVTGATADRAPDGGGWYNHAFTLAFQGRDAVSGVDSCASVTVDGPQGESAVRGTS